MILGIMGEVGSGKSTVCNILREHKDYFYIDADKIGHLIIEPGQKAYSEIVEHFGQNILNEDKTICRKKLGNIVFTDTNKLEMLNQITHKYIYSQIRSSLNKLRFECMFDKQLNVIIDAALLYEIRLDSLVDQVWYIDADKDVRLKRIMERNGLTEQEALHRINAQKISIHKNRADRIIINNGSLEELKNQIIQIENSI